MHLYLLISEFIIVGEYSNSTGSTSWTVWLQNTYSRLGASSWTNCPPYTNNTSPGLSTWNGPCGDGNISGSEACDDRNIYNGDGCSETWTIETGFNWTTGSPSVWAPICGDGK